MKDFESRGRTEKLLARFERGLLLVVGFFVVLLLLIALFPGLSGKAHAAGFNAWPHPVGMAQCWSSLFEEYGANMLKVTQTVSTDSVWVKYRITLQGGEKKELVCHTTSGKVGEAGMDTQTDWKMLPHGN